MRKKDVTLGRRKVHTKNTSEDATEKKNRRKGLKANVVGLGQVS